MLITGPGKPTKHICPNNCGRKYKHKRSLNTHVKFECSVPKTFHCSICNRSFALKGSFKRHMINRHRMTTLWTMSAVTLSIFFVFPYIHDVGCISFSVSYLLIISSSKISITAEFLKSSQSVMCWIEFLCYLTLL